jgi:rod shape-determining protein MreC
MRNLLNFLAKYNNLIIFLILEGISFYFLTTRNFYHNTQVVKGVIGITTGLETRIENVRNYFHLRDLNHSLAFENAILQKNLDILQHKENLAYIPVSDTIFHQQFQYTPAEVINNSITRQKNFFTINKGRFQGVEVDMAVLSDNGIAGVVVGSSHNYSVVMSVLNLDFKVSARLRSNGYFGSLSWDGRDFNSAILSEIPQHVTFGIGDTVETTGYSAVFPEGIVIGTVSSFEKAGGDFFKIRVLLNTDFRRMHFVTVAGNLRKKEEKELENQFK